MIVFSRASLTLSESVLLSRETVRPLGVELSVSSATSRFFLDEPGVRRLLDPRLEPGALPVVSPLSSMRG